MLYLKNLEIENVRCFGKKQRIDFTDKNGDISQWTVILGDNGTGKTTLLKSIVSMLPAPQSFLEKRTNLDTEYFLSFDSQWKYIWDLRHKEGEKNSLLSLNVVECEKPFSENVEIEYELRREINHSNSLDEMHYRSHQYEQGMYDTKILSPVKCFAYGANRKMAEKSLSDDNLKNTNETLFKDEALLPNSSEYFLRVDYETAKNKKGNAEKNRIKDLLIKILPSEVQDIEIKKSGRLQRDVKVKTDFGWVKLNELGLGYKTTIAWLIDFATKMIYFHEKRNNPFEEPAILVIDEIDLHMHPEWLREIIDNLTLLFPNTQFIVSAHSPLIAQAALNSNLILLKKRGDHVEIENAPDIIRSWRIDQVLTSDLFGLKNARTKEFEDKINRRRNLLKKEELTSLEQQELNDLNIEVYNMPIGETSAEIEAMDILKDLADKIAKKKKAND
jgi:predicted ATP-binding protein involved in virulence